MNEIGRGREERVRRVVASVKQSFKGKIISLSPFSFGIIASYCLQVG